jgi:hypothetical protein
MKLRVFIDSTILEILLFAFELLNEMSFKRQGTLFLFLQKVSFGHPFPFFLLS